ncbi:MAG TPA: bifunctional phosphoglucose/phosphomannose isomerase [Anaerolineales bacterium]|nr:bifunctional phosphoglucose/phosphomannose isomerase [Anaerolineales bacterium]
MNLDDISNFTRIDTQNYLAEIDGLPAQLEQAWELGSRLPLPAWTGIQRVVVAGMGGSAIGADLLAAYAAANCPVPLVVHRSYGLPAWAHGPETLLITSSHSGNTEETLTAFYAGLQRGCRILALCTGGKIAEAARQTGCALWIFAHQGQPRAAVGYSFGLLLAALSRLGLLPDPRAELTGALAAMRQLQEMLRAGVPTTRNPAKRLAGQLVGRWVAVFGSDLLEPVARRWKGQVAELAKAWGQFEFLPEADHNTLAGLQQPAGGLPNLMALFLRAPSCHPRNLLRSDLTRQAFMLEGVNTDFVDATGDTPLAHQWTALLFGDYVAFYLAMAYEIDPTPIAALVDFKHQLEQY